MVSKSRRAFLAGTLGAATIPLAGCWSDDTTPVATRYQTAASRVVEKYRIPGALASVRDWSTRSLQIVLETQVIDGAAGAPRVVATHVW